MARRELPWFRVGRSYGSNQEMMADPWLRFGGCAAITAVDSSICFAKNFNRKKACPYDLRNLNQRLYDTIAAEMKPYLRPRFMGVNRLEIYTEGFGRWLSDHGETGITLSAFHLDHSESEARDVLRHQIDAGLPVPFLLLSHDSPAMKDWLWHWFLLCGYEEDTPAACNPAEHMGMEDTADHPATAMTAFPAAQESQNAMATFRVKAVTYGAFQWLDFSTLWNTGHTQDGGMIIYQVDSGTGS